jgi:membrane protein DedA with SNARE-associated domain
VLLGLFIHVPASLGYIVVGLLIGGESAGIPLPGETSLIAAAVLAAQGHLNIAVVIVIAAAAAIVGDNIGYLIGRRGGRWILTRPGPWHAKRIAVVERGDAFFKKHGAKTVFLGRWLPVLRITAAWMAGVNGMHWQRFAVYNALGGIGWATSIGLLAYYVGDAAETAIRDFGIAGIALVVLLVAVFLGFHVVRKRREERGTRPEPVLAADEPAE